MGKGIIIILAGTLCASACGGSGLERGAVSASELHDLATEYESIALDQIEAWNSHDVEQIRSVYTADAVHLDGTVELSGIEAIAGMAAEMDRMFPAMEGRLEGVFTGRNEVLDIWEIYGVLIWTSDDPVIEYDLLEIRDGKIASWSLYYDPETRPFFSPSEEQDRASAQLLDDYVSAWSSGDPAAVAGLYAASAVRVDTVFDELVEGNENIGSYAAGWFDLYPGSSFELLAQITERTKADPTIGGVFSFKDSGCDIRMAILLDTSEMTITRERLYYDVDTLVACGWAS